MHDGVSLFSPERMETLTCGHLRLVDDAEPAGVFVKRPLAFHGSGFAIEQHRFGLRMGSSPFLKSALPGRARLGRWKLAIGPLRTARAGPESAIVSRSCTSPGRNRS